MQMPLFRFPLASFPHSACTMLRLLDYATATPLRYRGNEGVYISRVRDGEAGITYLLTCFIPFYFVSAAIIAMEVSKKFGGDGDGGWWAAQDSLHIRLYVDMTCS
ncbi:hypothetical protein M434DRAFT_187181 [Hypoxylon sp. CO27-5]|nr:hypothetical protein M434DRAFT_187181 [Hypoxylon sp. CO27-5]